MGTQKTTLRDDYAGRTAKYRRFRARRNGCARKRSERFSGDGLDDKPLARKARGGTREMPGIGDQQLSVAFSQVELAQESPEIRAEGTPWRSRA